MVVLPKQEEVREFRTSNYCNFIIIISKIMISKENVTHNLRFWQFRCYTLSKLQEVRDILPKQEEVRDALTKLREVRDTLPKQGEVRDALPKLREVHDGLTKLKDGREESWQHAYIFSMPRTAIR